MFPFRVGVPTLVCVLYYTLFSRKFNFKGFFAENKEPFSFSRTEPIERELLFWENNGGSGFELLVEQHLFLELPLHPINKMLVGLLLTLLE